MFLITAYVIFRDYQNQLGVCSKFVSREFVYIFRHPALGSYVRTRLSPANGGDAVNYRMECITDWIGTLTQHDNLFGDLLTYVPEAERAQFTERKMLEITRFRAARVARAAEASGENPSKIQNRIIRAGLLEARHISAELANALVSMNSDERWEFDGDVETAISNTRAPESARVLIPADEVHYGRQRVIVDGQVIDMPVSIVRVLRAIAMARDGQIKIRLETFRKLMIHIPWVAEKLTRDRRFKTINKTSVYTVDPNLQNDIRVKSVSKPENRRR